MARPTALSPVRVLERPAARVRARGAHVLAAVIAVSIGACSGSTPTAPSTPAPPPAAPPPLTISCPSSAEVRASQGRPVPLAFTVPQAQGGTAPVSVACTPAPGFAAPVGDTKVTCTATDARQVTASCDFQVRVLAAPVLTVERVLTLGDSLTFGVVSRLRAVRAIAGDNYAAKLQTLLSERYFDQQPMVFNSGVPGERAEQIAGRYGDALRESNAQVMIVLAGANDLVGEGARAIPSVVRALELIARDAQRRGIGVILSTLPPQRPGSSKGTASAAVVNLNGQILDLCRRYGVQCADVYAAFGGDFSPLIGADGLHPTLAGYDRMAETYFDVIVEQYERNPVQPTQPTAAK